LIGLGISGAVAQTFPARTITMVVPFAAGGPTDTIGRLIAEAMAKNLGQQVVIENVVGAGGTRGAAQAARANPDGYTLLLHHIGMATSATLYRKLPFDAIEDFAPIGLVTDAPMTLIARPDFPAKDFAGVLAYIRANRDKVTFGNAGMGSASHLCGMLLMSTVGVAMTAIPYNGTGPAMTDLIGSQIDLMCDQTTNTANQIKSRRVKAYGVTTKTRVKSLPDLPTLDEAGLKGFEVAVWHGLYAPKGTPREVVARLTAALQAALKDAKVIARFADLGTEPVAQSEATPEALRQKVMTETARWRPVIHAAGVYAD
jgi:tripartite-type tricarboxylate transporter receptor subunit TctC